MYRITLSTGEVTRVHDLLVVAPCQSTDDPFFVEYIRYVANGGAVEVYQNPDDVPTESP